MRIDPRVAARFPGLCVAHVAVEGVAIAGPQHAPAVELLRAATEEVRATRSVERLKDEALFRAYRDFYWTLGIDPTKTRPAGEALNRRVLNGNALPTINAFVDAYNAASLVTGVPIGCYDVDTLAGPLELREARAGEAFQALNDAEPKRLVGGELVLADTRRIVNFYPYRDAAPTRITEKTTRAIVVACGAPGVPSTAVEDGARRAGENVTRACGGAMGAVEISL